MLNWDQRFESPVVLQFLFVLRERQTCQRYSCQLCLSGNLHNLIGLQQVCGNCRWEMSPLSNHTDSGKKSTIRLSSTEYLEMLMQLSGPNKCQRELLPFEIETWIMPWLATTKRQTTAVSP